MFISTGKFLSEALPFAEHRENMLCTKIVLNVRNNFCTQHVLPRFELGNCRHDCGLVDAKIRASDKDLLVCTTFQTFLGTWLTRSYLL